jgi:putative peptidoglycan lipid II flippase
LVGQYRGAGIAFALTIASAVNTVLLLIFLGKNPNINLGCVIRPALFYILKMVIFSAFAIIPLYFVSPVLCEAFTEHGRIIAYGAPLVISAIIYFAIGFAMLVVTKDQYLTAIVKMIKKGNGK